MEWGTPVQLAEGKRLWVEPGNRGKGVVEAGTPQWGRRGFVGEEGSRVGWLEVAGAEWVVEDDGPVKNRGRSSVFRHYREMVGIHIILQRELPFSQLWRD